MAGLACPSCMSQDFTRHRQPAQVADVTFRRHRCLNCRAIFLTAQVVVSDSVAEKMLTLTEQPRRSSVPMPNGADTSPQTLMDLLRGVDSTPTTGTPA